MPRSLSSAHSRRWGAAWSERAEQAIRILAGDAQGLGAGADPLVVAGALAQAHAGKVQFAIPGEVERLELLLVRLPRPQWIQTPGVMWAWVLNDERTPPIEARLAGRMGLCIDGAWAGWKRGDVDLRKELTTGLHRVALVDL
jgi:hypothetical protein